MSNTFRETERRVWGSNTRVHFQANFGFNVSGINPASAEFRRLVSFASRGKPFNRADLPVQHQIVDLDDKISHLPDFFYFNFYYASERVLENLREFDLGNTIIHPVVILDQKGQPSLGQYSIVATQNQKSRLLPELSSQVINNEFCLFEKFPVPKDDSICFDSSALFGPDIFRGPFRRALSLA